MENNIKNIWLNEEEGTLTISWDTGARTGALDSVTMKVEIINKTYNKYKPPYIPYNPDYNEAF